MSEKEEYYVDRKEIYEKIMGAVDTVSKNIAIELCGSYHPVAILKFNSLVKENESLTIIEIVKYHYDIWQIK